MASVTSRYSRAFADVVVGLQLDICKVREELRWMVDTVEGSEQLRSIWGSPAVPHEQKLALLDAISTEMGLVTPVRNFVAVLIDHGRVPLLPQIARQFEVEMNNRLGIADAAVVSARELSAEERKWLELHIATMTGKQVRAHYATDKNVLGGAVVKIGSTIYDGSVRGQLQRIRETLVAE